MSPETIGQPVDIGVMVIYFVLVVGFGVYFGKYSTTTKDFYFGGQRFAWWVIAFSGIATTIGSYSFIKYSEVGFTHGISSTQAYLNDWFWIPILLFLWLPVIYYNRIQSVPEYFEKRFGKPARLAAIVFILLYLITYVGVNLLTLGTALQTLLGWPVFWGACLAGLTVTLYVFAGGQTSVIMTDLVQGVTLLLVGLGLFFVGVAHFGGFTEFWSLLPLSNRFIFSEFAEPPKFSFIGIYMQDGIANTGAFILMNQGMMMRFLALRSIADARKMAVFWILILFPLAAITVSGGGWIATGLVATGELTFGESQGARDAFILAADYLCHPGVFGLVLAALMAALMSSADTLINAVSAVFVNDIYRPYIKKDRDDKHYLRVARISSLCVAAIGIALVPIYANFETIYEAHGFITASIPPPVVMAILLGLLWKRFNLAGALGCLLGGGGLTALSIVAPFNEWFLNPVSFGMGIDSFSFTRALFSLIVSAICGVGATYLAGPSPKERLIGLVNGTQLEAMRRFKGGEINRREGGHVYTEVVLDESLTEDVAILVPQAVLDTCAAEIGDLVYICDKRWWFGGLRSVHGKITGLIDEGPLRLSAGAMRRAHFRDHEAVYIEKVF